MADLHYETIRTQTLTTREMLLKVFNGLRGYEDDIPPKWNNNAVWHAGHLVITNRLLTYKLFGEELGYSEQYRDWFKKGASPKKWADSNEKPEYEILLPEIVSGTEALFDAMKDRFDEKFPEPYLTSVGVELSCPRESLNFSMFHDGIHLGMLLALKREMEVS